MLIGVLLVITWLILLLRYPAKALPVSLAAFVGLGLVAAWVIWQENRETGQLARLELRMTYAPERCPADRPLSARVDATSVWLPPSCSLENSIGSGGAAVSSCVAESRATAKSPSP